MNIVHASDTGAVHSDDRSRPPITQPHRLTVVHVVPENLRRGAQIYCAKLVGILDGHPHTHEVVLLRGGGRGPLVPTVVLTQQPRPARRGTEAVATALRLAAALRRLDADVVVAHGSEALKATVPVASSGVPLIYLRIGEDSPKLAQRWRRLLYRCLHHRCAAIVGVAPSALEAARAIGGPRRLEWRVIMNGRDPSEFVPRPKASASPPQLLFAGSLDDNKRPELFVEVVRRLRTEGVDVRATMLGDGPRRTALENPARAAGVVLLGSVDDVREHLAETDVFVFTSRPPEGLPGVLIEAGMSGIPIVATDVAAIEEVVLHGQTGLVVPRDDVEDLVSAVRRLVVDPGLRAAMGARARAHCVDRFDLTRSADEWNVLVDSLHRRRWAVSRARRATGTPPSGPTPLAHPSEASAS